MATRTWSGASNSDMNNSSNYDGSGALLTSDDLVFNSGAIAAIASTDLSVHSISTTAGYSGNWSISGFNLTVVQGASFDHTGTLNLGLSLTSNGISATVHVGSGVGTITATSCTITLNGTTGMTFNIEKDFTAKGLILGANAIVSGTSAGSKSLTLSNSATLLTLGASSNYTQGFRTYYTVTGACTIFSIGASVTWAGNGNCPILNNSSDTVNIPTVTYTGGGYWYFDCSVNTTCTTTFTGYINLGNSAVAIFTNRSSGSLVHTINFNTNNFKCYMMYVGTVTGSANNNLTVNFSSGTVTVYSHDATSNPDGNLYDGQSTQNYNTAQFTSQKNWIVSSNFVLDPGTSVITFTSSTATIVTTNGKSLYDITVNNASKAFSFSDNASIHNLLTTAMASYTHTGKTLTASGNLTFNGSGTLNLGNGVTMTGASTTLTLNSTLGTITASLCVMTMSNTGVIINDNKGTKFDSLVIGASATVTNNGTVPSNYFSTSTPLTIGNNATFTQNPQGTVFARSTSGDAFSIGTGVTFNGIGRILFEILANNITVTVPALTYTGSGTIVLGDNPTSIFTGWIFQLTGHMNIGSGINLALRTNTAGSTGTIDFNGKNITCGTFQSGSQFSDGILNINYSTGTHTIGVFNGGAYDLGIKNENFSSSIWVCSGIWTFGSSSVQTLGTFSVTLNSSTGSVNITSNGKSFYDLTINPSGFTYTALDAISCHNFTRSAGNWTHAGTTFTASGDITFNGTGTINLGTGITMTGASAILTVNSTVGTITSTLCNIIMNGTTGMSLAINKGATFFSLTLGASAVVTNSSSAVLNIIGSATVLTLNNNSTFICNGRILFQVNADASIFSVGTGVTWSGSGEQDVTVAVNNVTCTLPALTYTGSGHWFIYEYISTLTGVVFSLSGNINLGTAMLDMETQYSTSSVTFNGNIFGITCGALTIGKAVASSAVTYNYGSGTYSIASYSGSTYNTTGTTVHNFGTSQWTCSGSWTFGSNHTITHGWDILNITNTATITSNGKVFNWVVLNAPGKTITLGDNFICRAYKNTAGTLNKNSNQFAITGDYVEIINSSS